MKELYNLSLYAENKSNKACSSNYKGNGCKEN